jgi:hypothetical protein
VHYFTTGNVFLKLFFTGNEFIIVNNPVLIRYTHSFNEYKDNEGNNIERTTSIGIKYANGLKMQWIKNTTQNPCKFPIQFSEIPVCVGNSNRSHTYWCLLETTTSQVSLYQDDGGGSWDIFAIGY